jgi:hypothetical protein
VWTNSYCGNVEYKSWQTTLNQSISFQNACKHTSFRNISEQHVRSSSLRIDLFRNSLTISAVGRHYFRATSSLHVCCQIISLTFNDHFKTYQKTTPPIIKRMHHILHVCTANHLMPFFEYTRLPSRKRRHYNMSIVYSVFNYSNT